MKNYSLLFLLFTSVIFSQNITVNGNILDSETKEPLPGVSVFIQKSSKGTVSDFDGNFQLNATSGDKLIFKYIGYKKTELNATNKSLTVYMQPDVSQLEEVTVSVGYFDINKKDLSGSITQVKSEKLEKNRSTSVEQLIQGQVAGVVINESSEPGGGISVSIRGANSLLGGTQPLYVVDGIPIDPISDAQGNSSSGKEQSSLSFLNPNDIEKIEVLKDAAATAVYGARGANGVVIVTTKSGSGENGSDALTINVDTFVSEVAKNIDVMNGSQFENYMNQRSINQLYINITKPSRTGGAFDGSQALNSTNYPELNSFNLPYSSSTEIDNNWQDLTYRQAFSSSYNISYRGGDRNNNLSMSLGIQDTEGVVLNSGNKRTIFNVNGKRKAFNDKIDLFSRTNIAHSIGNASSTGNGRVDSQRSVVSQALRFQPIFELLKAGEDDDIYASLNDNRVLSNPFTLVKYVTDKKESINFIQNIAITAKLSSALTGTIKGAFNFQKSTRDSYYPTNTTRGRTNNGEATQSFKENKKIYTEASLRYRTRIKSHRFDAIVVGTYESNNIRSMFNKAQGFGDNNLTTYYSFETATDIRIPIAGFRKESLLSGLARIGYNYDSRYYLDINTRIDASSKFSKNNKSAVFPSLALSWNISREEFFSDLESISNLKLRLSYGKTGSNPISPYQSLALLNPISYNFNNSLSTGVYESNLKNENLSWETTDQFNAGLDMTLLDSKLNITIDTYYKLTYDLLQKVKLPPSNGFAERVDNFGEVENKGLEIGINAELFANSDFNWNITGVFSMNRNKLLKLNSNLDFQSGPAVGFGPINIFKEGKPLGVFWGAETNGIYSNWEEAIASGIEDTAPGEIRYVNNSIEYDESNMPKTTQKISFEDYVEIGDPNPDFNAAITNYVTYKNWDLSIMFTGQKGGDIFWVDSYALTGNATTSNGLNSAFENAWKAPLSVNLATNEVVYDSQIGNLTNAASPAPVLNAKVRTIVSDRQVYDGSFIRLKNINIGYTIQMKKTKNLRLYATGKNLLTWTKYPGYDPEIASFNKDPQRRGVDVGAYPGTKTISIGLKFNY